MANRWQLVAPCLVGLVMTPAAIWGVWQADSLEWAVVVVGPVVVAGGIVAALAAGGDGGWLGWLAMLGGIVGSAVALSFTAFRSVPPADEQDFWPYVLFAATIVFVLVATPASIVYGIARVAMGPEETRQPS